MEGPVDVKYQGAGSDSYGSDWWVRIHPDGNRSTSARRTTRSTLRRLGCGRSAHTTGITCRVRDSVESALAKASEAMREKRLQEKAAAPYQRRRRSRCTCRWCWLVVRGWPGSATVAGCGSRGSGVAVRVAVRGRGHPLGW